MRRALWDGRARWIAASLLLLVFALATMLLPLPRQEGGLRVGSAASVAAEEEGEESESEGVEKLHDAIGELISSLDWKELQDYLDSLSELKGISVKDKLQSVITGDFSLDYSSVFQAVLGLVWDEIQVLFPSFAVILAVTILCGVLNSSKNGFLHSTMSNIINFVAYLAVGAVTLSALMSVLHVGFEAMERMKKQMDLIYPILLTLMAGSGGAVSAAIFRPAVAFFSSGIASLFSSFVMPVAVVVIVIGFVGNLTKEYQTEKLGGLLKSASKWVIGLTLGLFTLFLSVQGISAAQYDGLSLRAAKYALSSSVPIVGGFLSGGADLVLAGSALIKNALGSFSIFLLFATVLRPVLLFAAFQLFLRLAAAATEPVGGNISPFLSRLAADTGYFIAALLAVAFLYFLTLLLLVCASVVIL